MVQVDGCEGLVSYADDHITLSLTDRTVTIYGNELSMKTFCQGQVAICGKILGVMEGDCKEEDENAHH